LATRIRTRTETKIETRIGIGTGIGTRTGTKIKVVLALPHRLRKWHRKKKSDEEFDGRNGASVRKKSERCLMMQPTWSARKMKSVAGRGKRGNKKRRLTPNGMLLSEARLDAEKSKKTRSESATSVNEKTVLAQTKKPRRQRGDGNVPREKLQDAPLKKKTRRVFFLRERSPNQNLCHRRL
jgi:hypothetical protein